MPCSGEWLGHTIWQQPGYSSIDASCVRHREAGTGGCPARQVSPSRRRDRPGLWTFTLPAVGAAEPALEVLPGQNRAQTRSVTGTVSYRNLGKSLNCQGVVNKRSAVLRIFISLFLSPLLTS